MRLGVRVLGLAAVALCASGATALAASTPKLEVAAVKQIALRSAQFHATSTSVYQPDSRLEVEGAKLSHVGKTLVWQIRLHSTVVVFPCKLAAPGSAAPACVGAKSKNALVTIAATTGRVLSLKAVDAAGHVLTVKAVSDATSPCPGVLYAAPPASAPAAPAVTCSSGLVGVGNAGIPLDQVSPAMPKYGAIPSFIASPH